jgi:hypothetical protein
MDNNESADLGKAAMKEFGIALVSLDQTGAPTPDRIAGAQGLRPCLQNYGDRTHK